jgi:manganese transport protein
MNTHVNGDPYRLRPEDVETPPQTLGGVVRRIGPGLILAAGIVGSGELIATTILGAENGYSLLWLILVSCSIKVVAQNELGRYCIGTGETTLEAFDRVPGPRLRVSWLVWLYFLLVITSRFSSGAMLGAIAEILNRIAPGISITGWVWLTSLVTLGLLLAGRYAVIEKVALGLIVTFTALTVSCAFLLSQRPEYFSWGSFLDGLSFDLPQGGFVTAVTVFGITGAGTMDLISYPYWCIEKGYARFTGPRDQTDAWRTRALGWIRVMGTDVLGSMILYTFPTVAFYLLGAGILHSMGVVPQGSEMVGMLSNIYTEILGENSLYPFLAGAFAVLYSTVFTGTAAISRGFADFLGMVGAFDRRNYVARLKAIRILVLTILFLASLFFMFVEDPVVMVKIGGVAQALTLPIIAFATIYLRYRHMPKQILPRGWITLALWVTSVIITVMMGYAVLQRLGL